MARKQPPTADICLLLEGTYPYVSGGVSTWVHQIITAYPQWKFAIFYLGGQKDAKAHFKYAVPSNVTVIEELYLFDPADSRPTALHRPVSSSWNSFYTTLRKLFVRLPDGTGNDLDVITPLLEHFMQQRGVNFDDFYHAPQTWSVLRELIVRCDLCRLRRRMGRRIIAEEHGRHRQTDHRDWHPVGALGRLLGRVVRSDVEHGSVFTEELHARTRAGRGGNPVGARRYCIGCGIFIGTGVRGATPNPRQNRGEDHDPANDLTEARAAFRK